MTDTEPEPVPAPRRSPAVLLLALTAGVLLVTTVAFGALAVRYKSQRDEGIDQRSDVASTAGELMHAMLNFDPGNAETATAAVLDLASGTFADDYSQASDSIVQAYEALGATSLGTIQDVLVSDVSADGTATAIVRYDQVVSGPSGTNQALGCYAELQLAHGPDRWTVNDVALIGCRTGDVGTAPGTGPTTSTTAAGTDSTTTATTAP